MSVLSQTREAIADLWEALTPPTDVTVTYRRVRQLAQSETGLTRRQFYFTPPSGDRETQFENSFTTIRSSFQASFAMQLDGRSYDECFDEIADEAVLLMNTVNFHNGYPNGCTFVQCTGWRVERSDEQYLDLILTIITETDEASGA